MSRSAATPRRSVQVGQDADDQCGWSTATRPVHPRLRGAVARWSGWSERATTTRRRREAGSPRVLLMVQLEAPLEVRGPGPATVVRSFVAGPGTRWTDTRATGRASGVHVELTVPAARRLLGVPLAQLTDRVVPLEDLDTPGLATLTERVGGCEGWPQRLDAVERALLSVLEAADEPTDERSAAVTARAWALLSAGVPVAEVAQAVGYSRRHLSRVLRSQLGLSPSQVAPLRRFSRARKLLVARPELSVAQVAAAAGYADHSHLVRDCRRVAGRTPSALRATYPST